MAWYNFWKNTEKRSTDEVEQSGYGLGLSNLISGDTQPAVTLSAVFAAIELISNSVAELPLNVKTSQDNKTTIVKKHPIYNIFDKCLLTKFMLIKMLISDMLLYGNGLAYIERSQDGTPTNLIYCPYGSYSIYYNEHTRNLYYTITSLGKGRVEPCNVIHLIKNSKNGVEGKGILSYAYNTIKLSSSTEKAAMDYFSSNCHVAGILSTDAQVLSDVKRNQIREAWRQAHGKYGTGMAILEAGMKYQAVSSNSRDAQMLESRLFNLQDIARFFNISPVLLGDLSHSSYTTIEASLLEYVTHTLYPYITLIENELSRKLIKPSEKNLYIDLDAGFILKSDKNSQANYLNTLVSGGIMTINEARQQLGLNPVENGNDLIIPYTDINQNKIGGTDDNKDTTNGSSVDVSNDDKNNI